MTKKFFKLTAEQIKEIAEGARKGQAAAKKWRQESRVDPRIMAMPMTPFNRR